MPHQSDIQSSRRSPSIRENFSGVVCDQSQVEREGVGADHSGSQEAVALQCFGANTKLSLRSYEWGALAMVRKQTTQLAISSTETIEVRLWKCMVSLRFKERGYRSGHDLRIHGGESRLVGHGCSRSPGRKAAGGRVISATDQG